MGRKVSIVIPVLNSGPALEKAISACNEQDYPKEDFEIIVVDDGSTEKIKDICDAKGVSYLRQERSGPAKARNTGWKASCGSIICFTDADCVPERQWLACLVSALASEDIAAVGGSYENNNPESLLACCIHEEIILRHERMPKFVKAIGSYNMAVRRDVLERINGFDEGFAMASAEDNDLSYRLSRNGYRLLFDPSIKVAHRHPRALRRYLASQFWHGFWRVRLYLKHPRMVSGDDYSNIIDYAQPFICLAAMVSLALSFYPFFRTAAVFFLAAEAATHIPAAMAITFKKGHPKYMALIPILSLRSFSRSLGMACGIIGGHNGK